MRGQIQYRQRAKQLVTFEGIQYGNITPTDVDFLIEFRNHCVIWAEFKHINAAPIQTGQKWALEDLVDNSMKPALAIVALHDFPVEKDIVARSTLVTETYCNLQPKEIRHWKKTDVPVYTLLEVCDMFAKKHGVKFERI